MIPRRTGGSPASTTLPAAGPSITKPFTTRTSRCVQFERDDEEPRDRGDVEEAFEEPDDALQSWTSERDQGSNGAAGHHPREGCEPALDAVPGWSVFERRAEFGCGDDDRGEDHDCQDHVDRAVRGLKPTAVLVGREDRDQKPCDACDYEQHYHQSGYRWLGVTEGDREREAATHLPRSASRTDRDNGRSRNRSRRWSLGLNPWVVDAARSARPSERRLRWP